MPFLLRPMEIWCRAENSLLSELKIKPPDSPPNTFLVFVGLKHTNCKGKPGVTVGLFRSSEKQLAFHADSVCKSYWRAT